MDKIRKSFRSRKKNDRVPESSKPHQWQEDERKVREGCCSFQVKVNVQFVLFVLTYLYIK